MKYPLYIFALLTMAQQVGAAVGDEVSGIGTYVAEGVSVKWVAGYLRADALEISCHDLMAQTYGVNLGL